MSVFVCVGVGEGRVFVCACVRVLSQQGGLVTTSADLQHLFSWLKICGFTT